MRFTTFKDFLNEADHNKNFINTAKDICQDETKITNFIKWAKKHTGRKDLNESDDTPVVENIFELKFLIILRANLNSQKSLYVGDINTSKLNSLEYLSGVGDNEGLHNEIKSLLKKHGFDDPKYYDTHTVFHRFEVTGIDKWDVSNVTNAHCAFEDVPYCLSLASWKPVKLEDAGCMFARSVCPMLGNRWGKAPIKDANVMFANCKEINESVTCLNLKHIVNCEHMFWGATVEDGVDELDFSDWQESVDKLSDKNKNDMFNFYNDKTKYKEVEPFVFKF